MQAREDKGWSPAVILHAPLLLPPVSSSCLWENYVTSLLPQSHQLNGYSNSYFMGL